MVRNRIYYRLKPLLPQALRMSVRRWFAKRKLEHVQGVWPVLPGSEHPPEGWQGWPEGKKFALVLTHDVEGRRGFDRCLQLMGLEAKLGLRSSFNLIPESGDYRASKEVRDQLLGNGFEVGVHDLHHDGKLFHNRADFARKAKRINEYIDEWGAAGFRSGFMLHNLDWLHDLNIEYDASTFDTDPFEPQPEGRNTIFPFWVPAPFETNGQLEAHSSSNGVISRSTTRTSKVTGGYVELPYTLPQDSTLFLVLREQSPDIWKRKVDWIVKNGGMLLMDTHPDYMNFNRGSSSREEYEVDHYRNVLKYIQEKYAGQYWHALPKDVAAWYVANHKECSKPINGSSVGSRLLKGRKAAVVLYSYYPSDPRPRRAAEALAKAGMEVDMICLRQKDAEPTREVINGVHVRRVPMRRRRDSKLTYLLQYGSFISFCTAALACRSLRKRYDLVHIHNMPDVLVFSGLVPKLRGARIILDQHDPMPELMRTIFGLEEHSLGVRLLKFLEKVSIGFADQVVTVNVACKKIFSARSCRPEKIQVIMNAPDEGIFTYARCDTAGIREPSRPFVLMYHGSIVERHGLDLAVQAVHSLKHKIPNIELRIYGSSTPFLDSVMTSVRQAGLDQTVKFLGSKSLEEIATAIHECDLGVIPNRRSVFTEINTPTRIFEYLALGRPVVAPQVPGITDYFAPEDLVFFELGNPADLARQIEYVYANPGPVNAIVQRGQAIYQKHCWTHEKQEFVSRVGKLLTVTGNSK